MGYRLSEFERNVAFVEALLSVYEDVFFLSIDCSGHFLRPCRDRSLTGTSINLRFFLACIASLLFTMLDSFEILTTSGVVLWSKSYAPVSSSIINGFIKDVFIEEKVLPGASVADDASAAQNPTYKKEQYTLKWASVKDLGLIFVVGVLEETDEEAAFADSLPRQSTNRSYI